MKLYDITVKTTNQEDVSLSEYQGKVLLVVNTATICGFTPQIEGLEKIYKQFSGKGFEILSFPSNQFNEAPGTDEEILEFCQLNYGVSFRTFAKISVNGEDASPLFTLLKKESLGNVVEEEGEKAEFLRKVGAGLAEGEVRWNFTKFLVDREGNVIRRYEPMVTPETIAADIEALL